MGLCFTHVMGIFQLAHANSAGVPQPLTTASCGTPLAVYLTSIGQTRAFEQGADVSECTEPVTDRGVGWAAVSAAFAALGRAFLCIDGDFRVVHASEWLDHMFGAGTGMCGK